MNYSPIKIAFDISPITGIQAGICRYVKELYNALVLYDKKLHIDLYTGSGWIAQDDRSHLPETGNQKLQLLAKITDHLGEHIKLIRKELNYFNQKRVFQQGISRYAPDIAHFTQNHIPAGDIPALFTFYDLSCFRYPETHPASRVKWQNKHIPDALERASHILTISQFSKNELISYFGIEPDKISVAYCGVGDEFKPAARGLVEPILSRYRLQYKKYLLSIGTLEPRKNFDAIIDAYQRLPKPTKERFKLAIIGAPGWNQEAYIQKFDGLIAAGDLILPGFVPQAHLPSVINGAMASLYPSLYEGFGLPVLESMACGIPVIASNTSSLPEVVGDKGILLGPEDVNNWTESILRIIEDADYTNALVLSGLDRAREFTWQNCAQQTINVYENLYNRY